MPSANATSPTVEIDRLARFGEKLAEMRVADSRDGQYIAENDKPRFTTITYRICVHFVDPGNFDSSAPLLAFVRLFMLPIEGIELLLRVLLYPFVWTAWYGERMVGRALRIGFYCPFCHHSTCDPYVCCKSCDAVQGRLRPTLDGLFFMRCARCGKHRWPVLGNYLVRRPSGLVCRNTRVTFGCYRPNPIEGSRPCASTHIAVAGVAIRSKHAVLSHLVHQTLANHAAGRKPLSASWEFNRVEASLLKSVGSHSYSKDTQALEQLGRMHCVARSLMIRRQDRRLIVFHHLAREWLLSETSLLKNGPNWRLVNGLVLVVDLDEAEAESKQAGLTHAAILERIIRSIQKYIPLDPDKKLPLKVAVVVPLGPTPAVQRRLGQVTHLSAADAEKLVREFAPSFYAVLHRGVPSGSLRFFGGGMPDGLALERTRWLTDVLTWFKSF